MAQPVKPQNPTPTCGDLRAYIARHNVCAREIAVRRGTTREAVTHVLRADLTGRPVTRRLLREILDAVNAILLEREQAACPSR